MLHRACLTSLAAGMLLMNPLGCSSSPTLRSSAHTRSASPPPVLNPEFLEQFAATRGFTHGTPKNISITPDGSAVLFLRSGPRSFVQDLFSVDTATGQEKVLLTADQILSGKEEHLTAEELARRERMRLASRGIASYALSKDGKQILVPLSGRLFVVDRLDTPALRAGSGPEVRATPIKELKSNAGYPIDPQFSPDGSMIACVREGDLYVTNLATGAETRLTTKSNPTITNGLAEFVAQEEMDRFRGFWWSPDSKQIAYEEADTAGMEIFHIADPTSPDKGAQTWPYPRPGKKNATVRVGVIAATGGLTTWIPWDVKKYEYLAKVGWPKDGPLWLLVMSRDQTEQTLLRADGASGSVRPILTESDGAWVNLVTNSPRWLPDGGFLWMSEKSGRYQLQSRAGDGSARSLGSSAQRSGLQGVAGVDHSATAAFVLASDDPTRTHVWRVPLGGSAPERLTDGAGVHGLTLADESDTCVHAAALLDGTTQWKVRRLNSREAGFDLTLTREDPPWIPKLELTTCGSRDFHAAVIRPRTFDPKKKYPVIVSVYGGPHHQMVRATPHAFFREQWIADQGFIVCCIDGRGTPGRGRDWERAIKNDLIGPALDDQVEGLQALGAKYPEMDMSRVGIYGWSFGGYFSAMAAMQRPDVFHAACAGAPVCDWLDYDTCYTERYLGIPPLNKDGRPESDIYTRSNVLTYCKDLKVPLLIIHGTADDNVYFMHSLKMTQALFRAGKDFEFLPLAGFTHMVPDPVVTTRLYSRVASFFIEKLGVTR